MKQRIIQELSVVSLIKAWIEFHPEDFQMDHLRSKLDKFNNEVIMKAIADGGRLIQAALDNIDRSYIYPFRPQEKSFPPVAILDMQILKPDQICFESLLFSILAIYRLTNGVVVLPTMELARQITLMESEFCCAIRLNECLKKKWSSKDRSLAPNILALIEHFNRVCFVVLSYE